MIRSDDLCVLVVLCMYFADCLRSQLEHGYSYGRRSSLSFESSFSVNFGWDVIVPLQRCVSLAKRYNSLTLFLINHFLVVSLLHMLVRVPLKLSLTSGISRLR